MHFFFNIRTNFHYDVIHDMQSVLKGINESLLIEDVTGEQFQGKHIFTIFLKALADHFKTSIQKQKLTINLRHDLKWVLTVPAIWSEAAKKFMRHCAIDVSLWSAVSVFHGIFILK